MGTSQGRNARVRHLLRRSVLFSFCLALCLWVPVVSAHTETFSPTAVTRPAVWPAPSPASPAQQQQPPAQTGVKNVSPALQAGNNADATSAQWAAGPASSWALARNLGLALAIVVGLIYLSLWVLRTYLVRTQSWFRGGSSLTLLETVHLGPNRQLHLVRVGEKVLLLGTTNTQITTLLTLSSPSELEQLRASAMSSPHVTSATTSAGPFAHYLRLFGMVTDEGELSKPSPSTPSSATLDVQKSVRNLRDRIRAVRQLQDQYRSESGLARRGHGGSNGHP